MASVREVAAKGTGTGMVPRVAPAGSGGAARQTWATARAEVLMQWRRWGLRIAFVCLTGLLLLLTLQASIYFKNLPPGSTYTQAAYTTGALENLLIYATTVYGAVLCGVVAALLVVDRIERDRALGMEELQRAAPYSYASYTLGKFLGNYTAVILPALAAFAMCGLVCLVLGWAPVILAKFLLAFVLVSVPCSLAAVAVSLLLASFLPVRIVQIAFPVLWFEFYLGLGWHGMAASIFNIGGFYIYPVFFPTPPLESVMPVVISLPLALVNIAALILTSVAAICLTYARLTLRRYRSNA